MVLEANTDCVLNIAGCFHQLVMITILFLFNATTLKIASSSFQKQKNTYLMQNGYFNPDYEHNTPLIKTLKWINTYTHISKPV